MNTNAEEKPDLEKKLPSGGEVTLKRNTNGWNVDSWKADGTNHWHLFFRDYAKALIEYARWND